MVASNYDIMIGFWTYTGIAGLGGCIGNSESRGIGGFFSVSGKLFGKLLS